MELDRDSIRLAKLGWPTWMEGKKGEKRRRGRGSDLLLLRGFRSSQKHPTQLIYHTHTQICAVQKNCCLREKDTIVSLWFRLADVFCCWQKWLGRVCSLLHLQVTFKGQNVATLTNHSSHVLCEQYRKEKKKQFPIGLELMLLVLHHLSGLLAPRISELVSIDLVLPNVYYIGFDHYIKSCFLFGGKVDT